MIRFCQTHSVHRGGYVTVGICCWQITYSKDQSQGAKPMNLCITTSFISTTLDVAGYGEMRCLAEICTLRVLFSSFLFFFFKTAFTTKEEIIENRTDEATVRLEDIRGQKVTSEVKRGQISRWIKMETTVGQLTLRPWAAPCSRQHRMLEK